MNRGQFHCPCHRGFFDMHTGQPLAGPPRRPLPRIVLKVQDGVIYAAGFEEIQT
jgi:Rieske Fe-S protein